MSTIREVVVNAAHNRAQALVDYNIHNNFHKQIEFMKQKVLADESITEDEKIYAMKRLDKTLDKSKIKNNEGTKRICENCNQECLATLYCEYCVRNYLKANFSNWSSGNNDIDNLIQNCQLEALMPEKVIEWIPYDNFENIKYLTEGGCSKIYTADWIDGSYYEWDSKNQRLTRECESSSHSVILKRLENVENANQSWLEEVCNFTFLSINN